MSEMKVISATQAASETADRLRDLYPALKSVTVIPSDFIDLELWAGEPPFPPEESADPFSATLGELAAPALSRELTNSIHLKNTDVMLQDYTFEVAPRNFRIAVAGGTTISSVVEHLSIPREVITRNCTVTPLVIGPIPETIYSAGFLAEKLAEKLGLPPERLNRISETHLLESGFSTRLNQAMLTKRNILDKVREKKVWNNDEIQAINSQFDWLLVGVGAKTTQHTSRALKEAIRMVYPEGAQNDLPEEVVGDICSRLFTRNGQEYDPELSDRFVGITLNWLNLQSNKEGCRVIVVCGGMRKIFALRSLLQAGKNDPKLQYFNVLVTDELTARMLLRLGKHP